MTQPEQPPAGEFSLSEAESNASGQSPVQHCESTKASASGESAPPNPPLEAQPVLSAESKRLPHVPKPTILYMMGWTATTAVVLAVLTQLYRLQAEMDTPAWAVLLLALLATVLGWFYCGALLILWHAVRRTLWRLEPGEWLILILINGLTLTAGISFLAYVLEVSEGALRISGALMLAQLSLVMAGAALFQRQRLPWRLLFAMAAAIAFPIALGLLAADVLETMASDYEILVAIVAMGVMLIPCPVCLGLLIAGIIRDVIRREARHYLHWSGVAMTGLIVLPFTIYVFLGIFMLLSQLVLN